MSCFAQINKTEHFFLAKRIVLFIICIPLFILFSEFLHRSNNLYLCDIIQAMVQDLDIQAFVTQWNNIYSKTMKFLKESETDNTMFLLYKVEYTEDTYRNFTRMATVMSNDPQYIQAVRKASNKKPHLSVINEGGEAMLMLCLMPLV